MLTETVKDAGWLEVGHIDDIPKLGARVVKSALGDIAIFRNASDQVFAMLDRCPHKGGPLSQGIVHDNSVTCPLHNWIVGLDDGMAKAPDEGCVKTFSVKNEDGTIYLLID